jgi:hypothetical protein
MGLITNLVQTALEAQENFGGGLICRGVPPWAPLLLEITQLRIKTGCPRRDTPTELGHSQNFLLTDQSGLESVGKNLCASSEYLAKCEPIAFAGTPATRAAHPQ